MREELNLKLNEFFFGEGETVDFFDSVAMKTKLDDLNIPENYHNIFSMETIRKIYTFITKLLYLLNIMIKLKI